MGSCCSSSQQKHSIKQISKDQRENLIVQEKDTKSKEQNVKKNEEQQKTAEQQENKYSQTKEQKDHLQEKAAENIIEIQKQQQKEGSKQQYNQPLEKQQSHQVAQEKSLQPLKDKMEQQPKKEENKQVQQGKNEREPPLKIEKEIHYLQPQIEHDEPFYEKQEPISLSQFLPQNRSLQKHAQDIIDIQAVFQESRIHDTVPSNVSQKDKEIFWAQNIIRANPHFAVQLLEDLLKFYQGNNIKCENTQIITKEGSKACIEAIEACKKQQAVKPLIWSNEIYKACIDHTSDSINNNFTGHGGSDSSSPESRMDRYSDSPFSTGENISYGKNSAFGVITGLIIDDGVPSRGHRTNIFNSSWRMGALSYQLGHPTYDGCCVLDYTSYSQPKGQQDIKKKVNQEMNLLIQPKIDEWLQKYKGGSWKQQYSYDSPARISVTFESKSGAKEKYEATLNLDEILFPNVELFDQ